MRHVALALILAATGLAACVEEPPQNRFLPPAPRSCADRPYGEADRHEAEPDYGCSTASNLAAMLANPADLDAPQDAAAPRGDSALAAVERHRLGQDKRLPGTTVGGVGAASSSSSSQ